jgi:uncharacterized membrane protein YczE
LAAEETVPPAGAAVPSAADGGQAGRSGPAGFKFFRRLFLYLLGNFVLAFGVSLAVRSELGITAVNSVAYVTSRIYSVDHGLMTSVIYSFYILVQVVILRRKFRIINLFQFPVTVFFGFFVSVNNRLTSFMHPEIYPLKLLLMLASIFFMGLGIMLYLAADLIPQPADGVVLVVARKSGWKTHNVKVGFDTVMVGIAALVSLAAAGRVIGLREGTLLAMLGVGKTFGFFNKFLRPAVIRLLRL